MEYGAKEPARRGVVVRPHGSTSLSCLSINTHHLHKYAPLSLRFIHGKKESRPSVSNFSIVGFQLGTYVRFLGEEDLSAPLTPPLPVRPGSRFAPERGPPFPLPGEPAIDIPN